MNEPSERGIAAASAALAKAGLFDSTTPRPDPAVVAAWAQILDDVDPDEAIAAVTKHYGQANPIRIGPGAILALVRAKREDDYRRSVVRRRELEAPRDPDASHRGYLEASAAISEALAGTGTAVHVPNLDEPCPWCHARTGEGCTSNGNRLRNTHPSRPGHTMPANPMDTEPAGATA